MEDIRNPVLPFTLYKGSLHPCGPKTAIEKTSWSARFVELRRRRLLFWNNCRGYTLSEYPRYFFRFPLYKMHDLWPRQFTIITNLKKEERYLRG